MGLVGGQDLRDCVARIMSGLISLDLSQSLNWLKRGGICLKTLVNVIALIKGEFCLVSCKVQIFLNNSVTLN